MYRGWAAPIVTYNHIGSPGATGLEFGQIGCAPADELDRIYPQATPLVSPTMLSIGLLGGISCVNVVTGRDKICANANPLVR
jgi:hypothetical protein